MLDFAVISASRPAKPMLNSLFTVWGTDISKGKLHQCTPALFAWTPTNGPYYLSVTTTSSSSSHHVDEFDPENDNVVVIPHATSASWIVDVLEGQQVIVQVRDSDGRVAETFTRTVGSGPSHCL